MSADRTAELTEERDRLREQLGRANALVGELQAERVKTAKELRKLRRRAGAAKHA